MTNFLDKGHLLFTGRIVVASAALMAGIATAAPTATSGAYRLGQRLETPAVQHNAGGYQMMTWEALLPSDWNPNKLLEEMKLEELQDNDPKTREVMKRITDLWKAAPFNPDLNRRRIRISGFVVPLEGDRDQLREFLLVPYFGACLHLPPPPANQIIHVVVPKTAKPVAPMNAAWISGAIEIDRSETPMATTAYRMVADIVEPFKREWTPF